VWARVGPIRYLSVTFRDAMTGLRVVVRAATEKVARAAPAASPWHPSTFRSAASLLVAPRKGECPLGGGAGHRLGNCE
jgi:hypothetical protein